MEVTNTKNGVTAKAYKGDAMTLLAFDLDEKLLKDFVGFTIKVKSDQSKARPFYIYNKMRFDPSVALHATPSSARAVFSSEFSPIQKFRWIHVPSTKDYLQNPYFGKYTYEICPRYVTNNRLLPASRKYSVSVEIDVGPFKDGKVQLGFSRSFVSSQAFAYHFGNNLSLRPNREDITFDIKAIAGSRLLNSKPVAFTYEDIHQYLGWQARDRVMEFLDEVLQDNRLKLDVFAYDLNEPQIVAKLLELGKQGRVRIILDDYPNHSEPKSPEMKFDVAFRQLAANPADLFRGNYSSQAHSKIFIQRENNVKGKAVKTLTGSTNFTTNGLYVNANHAIIFDDHTVSQDYAAVFDASFSTKGMNEFRKSPFAVKDFVYNGNGLPDMTIRFSPHPEDYTDKLFAQINNRILNAKSDVLFAVMIDNSNSSILDAIRTQVESDSVFSYGITDERNGIQLYKPNSKRGVKVSALAISTKLPKPFSTIIKTGRGHVVHHKFVVVDFKGSNPVVYCGSSNLAYNPEQKNGDNLIEIRDEEIVTAFAIEAIRLIDHYHWLNKLVENGATDQTAYDADAFEADLEMFLHSNSEARKWYEKYYNPSDLRCSERKLLIK